MHENYEISLKRVIILHYDINLYLKLIDLYQVR